MWYPGSGVVLDCIVSGSLPSFLLWCLSHFRAMKQRRLRRVCTVPCIQKKDGCLRFKLKLIQLDPSDTSAWAFYRGVCAIRTKISRTCIVKHVIYFFLMA